MKNKVEKLNLQSLETRRSAAKSFHSEIIQFQHGGGEFNVHVFIFVKTKLTTEW